DVETGLAKLALTLTEVIRQVLEHQAVRRTEGGGLSDEEVERLGLALLRLQERLEESKIAFGLQGEALNIDSGPRGSRLREGSRGEFVRAGSASFAGAGRHPRQDPRQGPRRGGRHQDQPCERRAADDPDPSARLLDRQGRGDRDELVANGSALRRTGSRRRPA